MSIEALMWAMNLAPVPMDRGAKPNAAAAAVLIGIANHAGPDGAGAFPSVKTLMRYTRLSKKTVRTAIDRLAADKIIAPGDPAIVAAYIRRGDRRPEVWNLDMALVRADLDDGELLDVARMAPFLKPLIDKALTSRNANEGQQLPPDVDNPERGVTTTPRGSDEGQPLPPVPVDNDARGVAVTPRKPNEGQPPPQRGVAATPEPDLSLQVKPPAWAPPVDNYQEDRRTESEEDELLAALALADESVRGLPKPWRLDAGTRRRAVPKIAERLVAGWPLKALVEELTHSPTNVRRPGGLFMSRLDATTIAPPAAAAPTRPSDLARCPDHRLTLPCQGCAADAKVAS